MAALPDQEVHHNEVRLVGRVAADPKATVLPSGDELVSVRLVIERPPAARTGRRRMVDTVTCVAWTAFARQRLLMVEPDDIVEITGALRRRFWRSPQGPRNRYEVEVGTAAVVVGDADGYGQTGDEADQSRSPSAPALGVSRPEDETVADVVVLPSRQN
ncbi:single-stranded DNA-binding protein [Phytoactinopolyspora limicola]|uniref:single-stranded DNA-binding protein n=1 Tax=Phytoactinopolyspora limicola TaxID=2715536 RepID=UPI00140E052E|nr:single-stranded DNA-binding protein [Phytoactinopolyspora limicola]